MTIMTTAEFRAKHGPSPLSGKVLITSGPKPVPQSKAISPSAESNPAQAGLQPLERHLGVEADRGNSHED